MMRNMLKFPPFFKSQYGVRGSDTDEGFRFNSSARTFYVDASHPDANVDQDGTDPEHPISTITAAVSRLLLANGGQNGDEIVIAGGTAYSESVVIADASLYPENCKIIGAGNSEFDPTWDSGSATEPCLVLGATGWSVEGIHFIVPVTDAAIIIPNAAAPYAAGLGNETIIKDCYFDGLSVGLTGIDLFGAPFDVTIENNTFAYIQNAGNTSFCIVASDVSAADPTNIKILDNMFYECDNYVDAALDVSFVMGNAFHGGGSIVPAIILDLRAGGVGENFVVGNYFGGDYSNTGGYYANAGAPGNWVGNFAQDVAEAEVGDNGITTAVPAA